MSENKPLPCINCISFAICKSILYQYKQYYAFAIGTLGRRCQLFNGWLNLLPSKNALFSNEENFTHFTHFIDLYYPKYINIKDYEHYIEEYDKNVVSKLLDKCVILNPYYTIVLDHYCNFQDKYKKITKYESEIHKKLNRRHIEQLSNVILEWTSAPTEKIERR